MRACSRLTACAFPRVRDRLAEMNSRPAKGRANDVPLLLPRCPDWEYPDSGLPPGWPVLPLAGLWRRLRRSRPVPPLGRSLVAPEAAGELPPSWAEPGDVCRNRARVKMLACLCMNTLHETVVFGYAPCRKSLLSRDDSRNVSARHSASGRHESCMAACPLAKLARLMLACILTTHLDLARDLLACILATHTRCPLGQGRGYEPYQ